MALKDQIDPGSGFVDSDVRGENTAGTPLVSAELTGTGEEISDDYTVTISARAGSTGTVTVSASPNNPYHGRVTAGVVMDDATENTEVIPGVTLVFDNAAANGNTATVNIGDYQGSFDASGVGAGVPTAGVRHKVVNTGASSVADAVARLLPQAIMVRKTGDVFQYIKQFAEGATEKVSGDRVMPYAMTIDNPSGAGVNKVADLKIDGALLGVNYVMDLTTGTLQNSSALKATTTPYPYGVVDGPLEGLEFALHPDCADNDIANILIFSSRYVQIAPDVAGVAGTYGTDDVDLTESGQSTGVITAGNAAYFWSRVLVPASANSESNPHPMNVALQASESSDAGWVA